MRASIFLLAISLTLTAQASWFGGGSNTKEPGYANWNENELRSWLEVHNIPIPAHVVSQTELRGFVDDNWYTVSSWTYDQYASAQKAFGDLKETTFDKWDESRLREFLLDHGVVAPKGPRESLVMLAKAKYRGYTDAASSYSSYAGDAASTAIYGDTKHQMSKSAASLGSQATLAAVQATASALRSFDQSKDYVYSTWSENEMRKWLENKGLLKTKQQKKKDELLQMMNDAWGAVANPVWDAWSDSYIKHWLVSHHIVKSDYEKSRDDLIKKMDMYYYSASDHTWSNWSDSQLKQWLINHGVIKSDAQVSRDKMVKMVEDNYLSAKDTFWNAWSDNSIRDWLIAHGHLRTDAQVKRDELVKLANEQYNEQQAKAAVYLTWPDARLRAYLRECGVSEEYIPGSRPGLLQETRIRWIQTQTRAEALFQKIKDIVNSGVYKAEDALGRLLSLLSGGWEEGKGKVDDAYDQTKDAGSQSFDEAKASGEKNWVEMKEKGQKGWEEAKRKSDEAADNARGNVGEKAKVGGQKIKGEL